MGRSFTSTVEAQAVRNATAAACVANSSQAWTILFWFKSPSNSTGSNFAQIYYEYDSVGGDTTIHFHLKTTGLVNMFHRPGGFGQTTIDLTSTTAIDNNVWHWIMATSSSTSDHRLFIDGTQEAVDTTNTITNATTAAEIGIGTTGTGTNKPPSGAVIAHVLNFSGIALSADEGRAIAYGLLTRKPNFWWELYGVNSPEPEWSGGGYDGTITGGITLGDNPPILTPSFLRSNLPVKELAPVSKTVTDSGAGADSAPTITVTFTVADTGSGADPAPTITATIPLSDSGSGADPTPTIAAAIPLSDSGSGVDSTPTITAAIPLSDSGSGVESTPTITVILTITDSGAGADAISVIQDAIQKSVSDSGSGADTIQSITASLTIPDTGTGAESTPQITVVLTVPDIATATDLINNILATLQVADSAIGVDIATKSDSSTQIISIAISLVRRLTDFSITSRTLSFGITSRSLAFSLAT